MNEEACYLLVIRTIRGGIEKGMLRVLDQDDIQGHPLSLEEARLGLAAECFLHAAAGWTVKVKHNPSPPGFHVVADRTGMRRTVRAIHVDSLSGLGNITELN